jgi:hypothetical protein
MPEQETGWTVDVLVVRCLNNWTAKGGNHGRDWK